MPIAVPTLTASIVSSGTSLGVVGRDLSRIANAVAIACSTTFVLPLTLSILCTGTAGAGVVSGSSPMVGPDPVGMGTFINSQMSSVGLQGKDTLNFCIAIASGIIQNLPSLVTTGVSPGVGVGVGTAKVTGMNNAAFFSSLTSAMASQGIVGEKAASMAKAISDGVCLYLNSTGVIPTLAIAGPSSSVPAAMAFPGQFV